MASPTAQARNYQQSYHQSSAAPNMRYPAHPETTETISALQNRIAVLDTQLAYANKERAAAENATRHLLYIVAAQSGHSVCNRNPTRNTPCSAEAGHALQNSDSTLLDLMDTEDPGLLAISPPELDHSDESTTSEADQDEYLQSFPVIEEGMRQVNTSHAKDGPPLSCKLDHKDMSNEDLVSGDHRGSFPRFEKELLFPLKEKISTEPTRAIRSSRLFYNHPNFATPTPIPTTSLMIDNSLSASKNAPREDRPINTATTWSAFAANPIDPSGCLDDRALISRGSTISLKEDEVSRSAADWNRGITLGKADHRNTSIDLISISERLFASKSEREVAIMINKNAAGSDDLLFPDIFRFGIRYQPTSGESNAYRTVSIMNLPTSITENALISKIRGGILVSAELLDTTSITRSGSALVTFLYESSAKAFEKFASENGIYFAERRAHVKLLATATWPMRLPLQRAIFDHSHTRCLEISNFPCQIRPSTLRSDLRMHKSMHADAIEYMRMRDDGILEIHFTSVSAAGKAYGILTNFRSYHQCHVKFSEDPCSFSLE